MANFRTMFGILARCSQTLHRDAALVSRPKEQATRSRVLLRVKNCHGALEMGCRCLPLKADVDQPRLEMTF
jgi:hypothetical protein